MSAHIHIHSGDSAANTLAAAGLTESSIVWTDVLHIGALDWRWPDNLRHAVRAHALRGAPYSNEAIIAHLRKQDAAVEAVDPVAGATLWIDPCLYDQLILCFLLDRLYERVPSLQLLCVAEFPGIPRFCGYGQLTPPQMLSLLPLRRPVTREQVLAARLAWRAAATPERSPQHLRAIASQTAALPFLPAALERFADEFADADGLSRTDRQILALLKLSPLSRSQLFRAASDLEPFPFMGDDTFFDCANRLVQRGLLRLHADSYSLA